MLLEQQQIEHTYCTRCIFLAIKFQSRKGYNRFPNMDVNNTQQSDTKRSSDEVLIRIATDNSEVEIGNEKTTNGTQALSKAKRLVKQISDTLKSHVLRKQYSGTNLGFALSNYYLDEGVFGCVLQYFTEREMHYLTQVSKTLQNVILTHPLGWDKKLRKKYFQKLKIKKSKATLAKRRFTTKWPRKAFQQLGTKLNAIIWVVSYVSLIGVFYTYFFVHSKSAVNTIGSVALCAVVALFVMYIFSPFLFLACYSCKLLPPKSKLFRRHPDAIRHRSFDPACSSASEYYLSCRCCKDHFLEFEFCSTAVLVAVVIAVIGLASGSYGSKTKEQHSVIPYFVPLIYVTSHCSIFLLQRHSREIYSVCMILILSGIVGSTIAMLLMPSIPWQYALLPIYIPFIGCFQGLYSTFLVLISFCNCKETFLCGKNTENLINYGEPPEYYDNKPRCFSASTMFLTFFQCCIFFVIPWTLFYFGVAGRTNNFENGILVLTLIVCCPCATWTYELVDWLGLFEFDD